ncbi:MAG: caspase family protein [Thermoanaerobaculia bacterium]
MSHLYALLVGIDDYPVKPLKGCVNDALAWREHLEERASRHGRLSLEMLLDRDATRPAIIEGFRRHLAQASEGDTALFCFSGHGAEEATPLPYSQEEPGGVGETLVAWDSRRDGGFDLADKELAALIAEVATGGAHVVVALDSCHSGTATREPRSEGTVRRMRRSPRRRPPGTYWFEGEDPGLPPELDSAGGWRVLPRGRHVLLAACEDYQKAKECTAADGTKRGLFSYCLLAGLARLGPGTSYRELHRYTQIRVRNLYPDQNPQAEGDLERAVLAGGAAGRASRFHVQVQKDETVWLDGGAVHGVASGTEVAVLNPHEDQDPEAAGAGLPLATAPVVEVAPGRSRLDLESGALPRSHPVFPARITRLSRPPLRVHPAGLEPDPTLSPALDGSPLLAPAPRPEAADLLVSVDGDRCRLRRPGAPWELTEPLELPDAGGREGFWTGLLETLARWDLLANLSNPVSPLLDGVAMTVWEWLPPQEPGGEPQLRSLPQRGEILLPYREDGAGGPQARRITVHLANRHAEPVYYHLLALDEDFGVSLLPGSTGRLPGSSEVAGASEVWIERGPGIAAQVPDRHHARGITRRRDLLMLLVSTVALDATVLAQEGISAVRRKGGVARSRAVARRAGAGPFLESLLAPARHRELGGGALASEKWAASRLPLVSVRPTPWVALPGRVGVVEPVPGVRIHVPAGLRGKLRLHGGPPEASIESPLRGLPAELMPRLRPASLTPGLGSDSGLSTLELRLDGPAVVSAEAPFYLETETPPGPEESLVAVAWDGTRNHLVALDETELGVGTCRLAPLPAPAPEHGAIWLSVYALATGP